MPAKLNLKVINFWAGPGASKSTTAAGLFNIMKNLGMSVELVTEYAKDLTYERSDTILGNQLAVFAQQDARLRRLVGKVEWAITDSPLPLSLAYMAEEYRDWLTDAVWGAYERYENYDFLVNRAKPYVTFGRNQTEHEALTLDLTIRDIYREATDHLPGSEPVEDAWEIEGDYEAPFVAACELGFIKPRNGRREAA